MTTITPTRRPGYFTGTDIPFAVEPKNKNGNLHGKILWNYNNGITKRIALYDNGVKISETWFYTDGTPKNSEQNSGCAGSASAGIRD